MLLNTSKEKNINWLNFIIDPKNAKLFIKWIKNIIINNNNKLKKLLLIKTIRYTKKGTQKIIVSSLRHKLDVPLNKTYSKIKKDFLRKHCHSRRIVFSSYKTEKWKNNNRFILSSNHHLFKNINTTSIVTFFNRNIIFLNTFYKIHPYLTFHYIFLSFSITSFNKYKDFKISLFLKYNFLRLSW